MQELNRFAGCRLEYCTFVFGNEHSIALCEGHVVGAAPHFERSLQYEDETNWPVVSNCLRRRQVNALEFEVARRICNTR
jgi:hypothetical protein